MRATILLCLLCLVGSVIADNATTASTPAPSGDTGSSASPVVQNDAPKAVHTFIEDGKQWKQFNPSAEKSASDQAQQSWDEFNVHARMDGVAEQTSDIFSSLSSFKNTIKFPPGFLAAIRSASQDSSFSSAVKAYNALLAAFYRSVRSPLNNMDDATSTTLFNAKKVNKGFALLQKSVDKSIGNFNATHDAVVVSMREYLSFASNVTVDISTITADLKSLLQSLEKCPQRVVRKLDRKATTALANFQLAGRKLHAFVKQTLQVMSVDTSRQSFLESLMSSSQAVNETTTFMRELNAFVDATRQEAKATQDSLKTIKIQDQNQLQSLLNTLNKGGPSMNLQQEQLKPLEMTKTALVETGAKITATTGTRNPGAGALIPKLDYDPLEISVNELIQALTQNLQSLGGSKAPIVQAWSEDSIDPQLRSIYEKANVTETRFRQIRETLKNLQRRNAMTFKTLVERNSVYLASPLYPHLVDKMQSLRQQMFGATEQLLRVSQLAVLRASEMKIGNMCTNEIVNIEGRAESLRNAKAKVDQITKKMTQGESQFASSYVLDYARNQDLYLNSEDDLAAISNLRLVRQNLQNVKVYSQHFFRAIDSLRKLRAAVISQLY